MVDLLEVLDSDKDILRKNARNKDKSIKKEKFILSPYWNNLVVQKEEEKTTWLATRNMILELEKKRTSQIDSSKGGKKHCNRFRSFKSDRHRWKTIFKLCKRKTTLFFRLYRTWDAILHKSITKKYPGNTLLLVGTNSSINKSLCRYLMNCLFFVHFSNFYFWIVKPKIMYRGQSFVMLSDHL